MQYLDPFAIQAACQPVADETEDEKIAHTRPKSADEGNGQRRPALCYFIQHDSRGRGRENGSEKNTGEKRADDLGLAICEQNAFYDAGLGHENRQQNRQRDTAEIMKRVGVLTSCRHGVCATGRGRFWFSVPPFAIFVSIPQYRPSGHILKLSHPAAPAKCERYNHSARR